VSGREGNFGKSRLTRIRRMVRHAQIMQPEMDGEAYMTLRRALAIVEVRMANQNTGGRHIKHRRPCYHSCGDCQVYENLRGELRRAAKPWEQTP